MICESCHASMYVRMSLIKVVLIPLLKFLHMYVSIYQITIYIYMSLEYLYSHSQTDLFRSIRTHQCG